MVKLTVNGKARSVDVDPNTPLLWVIREQIGLTGTKYGCGIAACGSCTVLVDGAAIRSCALPVSAAAGKKIETVESLAQGGKLSKVQQAFVEKQAPQCGYCQTGMVMAVTALLRSNPKPSDADIDAAVTNICRCGTFQEVRAAVHAAAKAQGEYDECTCTKFISPPIHCRIQCSFCWISNWFGVPSCDWKCSSLHCASGNAPLNRGLGNDSAK